MRIAFLLPSAAGGGAERAMIAVANRFASFGHQVDLVMVREEGPFLSDVAAGVNMVDLGAGKIKRSLGALNRYVRSAKPELIVSALVGTDLLALVGKLLFRWKAHLHISVQNSPSQGVGTSQDVLERNWRKLIPIFYRFANTITAISSGVGRDVEKLLGAPDSVPIIHNPVDLTVVTEKAKAPSGIDWMEDWATPVILAVGRLVAQKDVPTLLRAVAKLRETRDVRLVVLGTGPDAPELEAEIDRLGLRGHAKLAGFSSNPFAAMAAADLFVLSSRWEGFANVVAEALACGAKVVSTDCESGPGEILGGGEFGWLVPVGDANAMARAMGEALDTPVDRQRQIERARHFEVEGIAHQYRELFRAQGLAA